MLGELSQPGKEVEPALEKGKYVHDQDKHAPGDHHDQKGEIVDLVERVDVEEVENQEDARRDVDDGEYVQDDLLKPG